MAFYNVRFDTGYIAYQTEGGPEFSTEVVVLGGGAEQRNQNWQYSKAQWNYGDRDVSSAELDIIVAFFRSMAGKAHGFLFKDEGDYLVPLTKGVFGPLGVGTGMPSYQLTKNYGVSGALNQRLIRKPVQGTFLGYRGAALLVVGAAAGNISVDYTTGTVTFVPDASSAVTSITPGTTTVFTCASNLGLTAGSKVYLSGLTGSDAALLNLLSHTINSITGAGPYTFTLATNTLAKTITPGSGVAAKYPQPDDVLTFSSEFNVPVRFDTDRLKHSFKGANVSSPGVLAERYFYLSSLPLVEIRV